ncbi:hypothetical protein [Roseovarius phycicola]|uniref:Uncharacterized protein n=1 Tax=Roseovarius phycicola TaxID=3080976 RepID=A0ABZ2HJK5_9RHOB
MGEGVQMSEEEYVLNIYRTFREKVVHEDNLVHQRMIWFVTLQALLFTSFAILLGDMSTGTQKAWQLELDQLRKLALVFSSVGMVSALAAALSVGAAFLAIDKAFNDWKVTTDRWVDKPSKQKIVKDLPSVVGAGKLSGTHWFGKIAGTAFPFSIGIAWLAIICEVYGASVFQF